MNRINNDIFSPLTLMVLLSVGGLLFLVSGCAERTVKPDVAMSHLPGNFSRSGKEVMEQKWWKALGDETLSKLIDRALQKNFSLKKAWNRLDEARAVVASRTSGLYPGLDVSGSGKVQEQETALNSTSQTTTTDQLQAVANYEVDLWNRIESSVEASKFNKKASREQLQSAAISLSAEVARTWYQLVDSYNQAEIIRNQLEVNRNLFEFVSNRYEYGKSRLADVLRQKRLKQGTKERLIAMNTQVKTLKHKLAVLLGQVPAKTDYPRVRKFPDLSEFPRTGIPGESVNRRPDVKSTFYQVQAADQKVASAIAKQYPRLNLTGSISSSGADAGTLFQNWLASLAADLTVPAFDAGQRQAEVRRTEAVLSRRLNDYKQTVLTAFREVEDALVREKHQRKQVKKIKQQFQTAKKTVEILRNRYANGATDFLSVLDAIQTKQQLQRDLATARRKIVIDRIGLYRALSGGWPMSREQTTTDNTEQEGV